MSAAVAAALKKIAAFILSDKELRGKLFVIIGSIVCGFLGLLCLPVVAIVSLGNMEIEPPEIDKSMFNEAAFIQNLSSDQQMQLTNLQNRGQAIEDAMTGVDCKDQTIKAQLIYLSFFDGVQNFNAQSYVDLFKNSTDDKALIDALNSTYGLKIDYSEFMKSYTFVMNATINQYMFADSKSKNAVDLAAWAENAYLSGWGYKDGAFGDRDESDRIRYADSAGLILGYLRYDPEQKVFNSEPSSLHFTSKEAVLTKCPMRQEIFCSTAVISEFMLAAVKSFSHQKNWDMLRRKRSLTGRGMRGVPSADRRTIRTFLLKNMTKRKRIIWDWYSGRFRLTKTAGGIFTALTAMF